MKYFDFAATTPMCNQALSAYQEAAQHFFGNSSSLHDVGTSAAFILKECRRKLAAMLDVPFEGIYFTSGGTESNLLAILSLARKMKKSGKHIITSLAEHTSVHAAMNVLQQEGFEITRLPFTNKGIINTSELQDCIRDDTVLIAIQHVNQEIGTIQPVRSIGSIAKERGILFHCDAVQSFGKLDLKEMTAYVDSLSVSSHKIYGPKGTGAVYINPRCAWEPVFPGLTHEKGFRGGTVDVPSIAAFLAAAEHSCKPKETANTWKKRRLLMNELTHPAITLAEGDEIHQLPSTVGIRISGVEGQLVMLACNQKGFAISTGSACQVGHDNGMKAVVAMGWTEEEAKQFFRISFSEESTEEDVIQLGKTINSIAQAHIPLHFSDSHIMVK